LSSNQIKLCVIMTQIRQKQQHQRHQPPPQQLRQKQQHQRHQPPPQQQ
ncbi:unnamed protein product, partial [Rotaria sp. Silwood1]